MSLTDFSEKRLWGCWLGDGYKVVDWSSAAIMTVLAAGRHASVLSTLLAIAAMFIYPGGSRYHRNAGHYTFFQNYLSDLGSSVAYGGASNGIGAMLFVACLVAAAIGLCASLVGLMRIHALAPASRGWANAAGAAGALSGISLIGVAFVPVDRYLRIHESLSDWAIGSLAAVPLLLGIAALRDPRFPLRSFVAWIILLLVLVAYVTILLWHPERGTERGHDIQVMGQKLAVLATVIILPYQAWEAEQVAVRNEL